MEEKNYLTEAFKAFEDLKEDVFDISIDNGLEKAKEFIEEPVQELEIVYDPLASDEDEIQDSYLGKAILQCEICQSMLYKDPSEVIIDEEAGLANVEEACPYCQSEDGFKVIGQVAEFCEKCAKSDDCEEHCEEETEDSEDEIEVDETDKEIEEPLEESIQVDDIDADADDKKEKAEAEKEKIDDDADSDKDYELKKDDLKESDKPAAISIEDAQKWVDYDMKKYGKISERTNKTIKKAGFQIIKDDHGDYEVAAGKFESCNEDFEKVEIETDKEKMSMTAEEDGKVTVTTEPKEEVKEEEVIEPVSDEVKAEFKTTEEESDEDKYTDIDIDEFDEEEFDSLGEQYLKRVYENVKSFKTTKGSVNGNTLKLEGLITFKSGKVGKTNFIFEAKTITKTGKLKFIGENRQFAKGKKSFTLTGKMADKKLVCESFNYNYVARDSKGKSTRLYGTINR